MPTRTASSVSALRRFVLVAASCAALLAPEAHANSQGAPPLMCAPPSGGSTCDPDKGPAVLSGIGNGGLDLGAGNPINLVTGNKYQRETDMAALPGVLGLEIVRHYNSAYSRGHSRSGILGRGWKLSYETSLHATAHNFQVLQADGSRIVFARDSARPDQCASHDPAHGTLHLEHTAAGTRYRWQWPDGEQLHFDHSGRLMRIHAPGGEFLSLRYRADGALVQVTDPQGRSLHLSYPGADVAGDFRGVRHIDSPRGRFTYTHGDRAGIDPDSPAAPRARAAALTAVRLPAAKGAQRPPIERRYHYEDERHPALLTGISVSGSGSDGVPMDVRINSWAYDERGRAIRSVRGSPEERTDEVQLRYLRAASSAGDGITEIRNAFGQLTRYHHRIIGGEYRIVQARGPGCASCAPGDRRYRYDPAGRLIEAATLGSSTELDAEVPTLAATRYRRDARGRVIAIERITADAARSEAVHEVQRLAYEDARWPGRATRITRPSVVAGAEHVVEFSFNAAGQLTEWLERGFSPLPVDVERPPGDSTPAPIERRLRHDYAVINGRSVLVAIDGPLPNGALDRPEDSDLTRLHWDARADFVQAVTRPGGRRSDFTRDARTGAIVAIHDDDGHHTDFEVDEHGEVAIVRASRTAGRAVVHSRLRDALGRDTHFGPGSIAGGDFRPQARLAYDHANRVQWMADARGFLSEHVRDREGRLLEIVRRSASMQLRQALPAAPAGASPARADLQLWPQQRVDDFGRIVATRSPDSGETRRGFDAADRLVWMRDALGNFAQYAYTADGRIDLQRITAAEDGSETLTRWRYAGRQLLRVEHPTQDQAFEYDARGLRIARIVTLRTHDGKRRFRTQYEYDDRARLRAHTLPDGSRVHYVRNGQGQVVAIERNPVRNTWLRRLARTQRIVTELERDLVGLRRYVTGNGIEALHQRSAQGALARIAYRDLNAAPPPALLRAAIGEARAQPTQEQAAPGAFGLPFDAAALVDHRYLWDDAGKLRLQRSSTAGSTLDSHAYDGSARLIASLRTPLAAPESATRTGARPESWRYAYDRYGRRILAQQGSDPADLDAATESRHFQPGSHRLAHVDHDASGQPLADGERRYQWDTLGRLRSVHGRGRLLARYRYDHRGLRDGKESAAGHEYFLHDADRQLVARLDAAGRITRQFLYLGEAPLLLIDTPHGRTAPAPGSFGALLDDFASVIASWAGIRRERLYWVHSNHLGAPEAVTDEAARIVWRARYTPFGEARAQDRIESDLRLDLRLPGQILDAETGLHYNRARYYDPKAGRYLSPDPLGTPDGPNAYAYAAFNPLKFIDPDGLALFAFDGTMNHDRDERYFTNVFQFLTQYGSGATHYVSGVGTTHRDERYGDIRNPLFKGGHALDSALNYTGPKRISRMELYFMEEADSTENHEIMTADIIGFSRGAAQAREFANRVAAQTQDGIYYYRRRDAAGDDIYYCQPVELRFIGLFDTVLSTNHSGLSYRLDIPDAFSYVAHAIALNEFRGEAFLSRPFGSVGAFPLESIHDAPFTPTPQAGRTRIEMGFIGSHSDIGGGYHRAEGDLSKIALNWMTFQAEHAGVRMQAAPIVMVKNPVIHDRSNAMSGGRPSPRSEDRTVHYRSGATTTQREMILASGMSYPDTEKYIQYADLINGDITGTVDAVRYIDWLAENGYTLSVETQ